MLPGMRFAYRLLAISLITPLFTNCGNTSAPVTNAVTGPFDDRGNYQEDWVDQPDKWFKPTTPGGKSKQKPSAVVSKKEETTPPPVVEVTRPDPSPASVAAVERPKPKPVAAKPTPKPKPKPVAVRHTVRKGDTLSGLARKYGSTVSKIQAANRIKGSVIRLGQTLTIPK